MAPAAASAAAAAEAEAEDRCRTLYEVQWQAAAAAGAADGLSRWRRCFRRRRASAAGVMRTKTGGIMLHRFAS